MTNIGELDLLRQVYGEILTTPEVAAEFGEPLPVWVRIKSAADKYRQRIIELQIDKGEASAISLAIEITNSVLILDDDKARKFAVKLGLEIQGRSALSSKPNYAESFRQLNRCSIKSNKQTFTYRQNSRSWF
jgi:predicted nucleic acid-binding protein